MSASVYVPLFISAIVHNGGQTSGIPIVGLAKYQSIPLALVLILLGALFFLRLIV